MMATNTPCSPTFKEEKELIQEQAERRLSVGNVPSEAEPRQLMEPA